MKIKHIISSLLLVAVLSSCTSYRKKAEDLAIPLVQALQDNDPEDATCLLPSKDEMNEVFKKNKGVMAEAYYNKYSKTYQKENLIAKVWTDFETAEYLTHQNNLNWDNVGIGSATKKDITEGGANVTEVTTNLRFPEGDYQLTYNAVQHKGNWYLLNRVQLAPRK